MYNLPNILTISRIVVIPVIFLSIYIHSVWWSYLAAVLFIVAAITDYFDGYLARSRNQTSALGRLLDPIADKLLVVSALVIVLANKMVLPISYIPVIVIFCREILVFGLREFLAEVKISMPVTKLAKWKTGFQMTALSLILLGNVKVFAVLGEGLLWVAGVLTFMTGYEYFQKSMDYVREMDGVGKKEVKAVKIEPTIVAPEKVEVKTIVKKEAVKKAVAKKTVAKKAPVKKAAAKTTKKAIKA